MVTGGSAGIGAAICKGLCDHDIIVIGMSRSVDRLNTVKKDILASKSDAQFHPVQCDIAQEKDIDRAFNYVIETFGGVDILINNAGLVKTGLMTLTGDWDELRNVMDLNFFGTMSCTRKAFKSMTDRDVPGYIITMSSVTGHFVWPTHTEDMALNFYAPSKFALRALHTVIRQELNFLKTKVRYSNISPGLVATDMSEIVSMMPRLKAADISDTVVYLLGTAPHVQVEDIVIRPVGETV